MAEQRTDGATWVCSRGSRSGWLKKRWITKRYPSMLPMHAREGRQRVSDYTGARALVSSLPAADWLLGDRGYDVDWFREDFVPKVFL